MPRYEYKCSDCEKTFEVVHGIDENVDTCEFCGGSVRRMFHPVGILFKGPGFYKTDNKSSGKSGGVTDTRKETQKSDDNGGPSKAEEPKKNDSDSKVSK